MELLQRLADACASCGLPVKGDCIESGEKVFHPGCMKCYVCGELLNKGVFFTWEDKPICETHYKVHIGSNWLTMTLVIQSFISPKIIPCRKLRIGVLAATRSPSASATP